MTLRSLRIALPAAVLGAAVVPATAPATPVITKPPKPCYVSVDPAAREVVTVRASGFTPTHVVEIRADDGPPATFDVNRFGFVTAKVQASYVERGERPMTITLTDRDDPAVTVPYQTRVTALDVTLKPRRAATSSRIRFRGRGFTRDKAIWGHYVLHGRVRKTVRFAERPETACGTFSVRRRQIPIDRPRPGEWTLQVDQQKRWSPKPHSVFVPIPITVKRIIGA